MAIVLFNAPAQWGYDKVSKELVALFVEPMPVKEPDPVNWHPVNDYVVRIWRPTVPNKILHT